MHAPTAYSTRFVETSTYQLRYAAGGEGKKARAWIASDNQPQSYIGAANALYDVEQEGKWLSKGDRVELSVGDAR